MDRALKYKVEKDILYAPFVFFNTFLKEMSIRMNDPNFAFDESPSLIENREKAKTGRGHVKTYKTKFTTQKLSKCPLHETNAHSLSNYRIFKNKTMEEKKSFISQHGLYFRCCDGKHSARE